MVEDLRSLLLMNIFLFWL